MFAVSLAVTSLHAQQADTLSGPITPASPTTGAGPAPATPNANAPHAVSYTVIAGDTLTKLATKFNTTRKKLETLNHLASYRIAPGQVILVPAPAKTATASAKAKRHYFAAQPVQDFDIPASTFASCPVPVPNDDSTDTTPASDEGKPPPIAALVSPSEMAADEAQRQREADQVIVTGQEVTNPEVANTERLSPTFAPPRLTLPVDAKLPPAPKPKAIASITTPAVKPQPKTAYMTPLPGTLTPASPHPVAPSGWASDSSHRTSAPATSSGSRFFSFFGSHSSNAGMNTPAFDPSNEWGYKFLTASRALGDRGIDYDDDWRPPGERSSWVMDCSNTSRWLYKSVANINLPRTASDQYYYLHLQGKAWDVPTGATGWADVDYLQRNLKPGDLLFWENTYRPERQPPITHVMVFLGTNERGQWIMAGSQSSRGGEHNRSNGGPDVYVFRPSQACGGYTTWFGLHKHVGRFCAFGRPLEADPSKLAAND